MRRFRFRLESLLGIRRYHEREWELKLAVATSAVIETRRGITESHEGVARSFDMPAGPLEPLSVLAAEQYRAGMAARIVALEQELEIRVKAQEKVRVGYLEASRARKVLDKLKERQSESWRREQGRHEIAVQNEIGAVQASRLSAENAVDAAQGRG